MVRFERFFFLFVLLFALCNLPPQGLEGLGIAEVTLQALIQVQTAVKNNLR